MDSYFRFKIVEELGIGDEEYTLSEDTRSEIDFVLDYNNLEAEVRDFYNKLLKIYVDTGQFMFNVDNVIPFIDKSILNKVLSSLIDSRYIRMASDNKILLCRTRADSVTHGGEHGLSVS